MASVLERVQAILIEKYSAAPDSVKPESTFESLGLDCGICTPLGAATECVVHFWSQPLERRQPIFRIS